MSEAEYDYQAGYWQYRVIHHPAEGPDDGYVGLHEVFYDAEGRISGYTEVLVVGNDLDDLRRTLDLMLRDTERHPVLEQADLPSKKEEV